MFLFRVLCASLLVFSSSATSATSATNATIMYDEIDLKLYDREIIQKSVQRSLNQTNGLKTDPSIAPSQFGGWIPYINAATVPLYTIRSIFFVIGERDWGAALVHSISNKTERTIARDQLIYINASATTVFENFGRMQQILNFPDASLIRSIQTILQDIDTELNKIVNVFAGRDSVFRDYPLVALPPISAVASLMTIFSPLKNAFDSDLSSKSFLACKMDSVIREYRFLAVYHRLNQVTIHGSEINPMKYKIDVFQRNFNERGYNAANVVGLSCTKKGCDSNKEKGKYCLKDLISKQNYTATDIDNCAVGYMEYLRHRIENEFRGPLELVEDICTTAIKEQRRPTGFGWLQIVFTDAHAQNQMNSTEYCDPWYKSHCNTYMKVEINTREVFRTETVEQDNSKKCFFFDLWKSPKVHKSAELIEIGLWDMDSGIFDDSNGTDDDLLAMKRSDVINWIKSNRTIPPEGPKGYSHYSILLHWTNEYEDDRITASVPSDYDKNTNAKQ